MFVKAISVIYSVFVISEDSLRKPGSFKARREKRRSQWIILTDLLTSRKVFAFTKEIRALRYNSLRPKELLQTVRHVYFLEML